MGCKSEGRELNLNVRSWAFVVSGLSHPCSCCSHDGQCKGQEDTSVQEPFKEADGEGRAGPGEGTWLHRLRGTDSGLAGRAAWWAEPAGPGRGSRRVRSGY